jgi:hypothetical protein
MIWGIWIRIELAVFSQQSTANIVYGLQLTVDGKRRRFTAEGAESAEMNKGHKIV